MTLKYKKWFLSSCIHHYTLGTLPYSFNCTVHSLKKNCFIFFLNHKGRCMKTLRALLLFSFLTLSSTTQIHSQKHCCTKQKRFFRLPLLANPELPTYASSIMHSRLTGPVLTGAGTVGLIALLLQRRGILGLPHLGSHVHKSAETAFSITLIAGLIAWLWHEFYCDIDPCIPQPYDFRDDCICLCN